MTEPLGRTNPFRVSLIIPTRNEAGSVAWVLERIPDVVDEVILVDSSEDGTVDAALAAYPEIVVLTEQTLGKGAALRAGFEAASGDVIVIIDADGSMDPAEIPRYVALLDQGFDFVKGSRHIEGGGSDDFTFIRSFGNTGLRMLANALYSARFTDLCYGFLAFRREHLRLMAPSANGFEIEAELVLRAKRLGLRITEVPTFEAERRNGVSKLNALQDGWRILQTIMREHAARLQSGTLTSAVTNVELEREPPVLLLPVFNEVQSSGTDNENPTLPLSAGG